MLSNEDNKFLKAIMNKTKAQEKQIYKSNPRLHLPTKTQNSLNNKHERVPHVQMYIWMKISLL